MEVRLHLQGLLGLGGELIAFISRVILILPCHVTTHTNFPVTMIESVLFARSNAELTGFW